MSNPEQLEFSRSVEGTFIKGLGPELTPEVKARLRDAGLDLDRPLLPAYPAADFHRWVKLAATQVYNHASDEEACRMLGFRTVAGLEDTTLGRAIAGGLKLLGPKRTLARLDRVFRNNNNYLQVNVSELGDTAARVELSHVFGLPSFYVGVFEAAMKVTGAKSARVSVVTLPVPGAILRVEWQA